jgi:hypothetical protein
MTDFGVVSPLVHLGIYPQANLARRLRDGSPVELLAGENSDQKWLTTGIANLRAVATESNAEDWCSAVDSGGKEDFINLKFPEVLS